MSSSSATATGSRSPSPATPATPDSSHSLETIAIHSELDLSTWYKALSASNSNPGTAAYWEDGADVANVAKEEDGDILSLDDLIQDYAYDDLNSHEVASSNPPLDSYLDSIADPIEQPTHDDTVVPPVTVSPWCPTHTTKPAPPPASQPRKRSLTAASQTIVYPPRESCSNLPIIIPSIPEGGTKSRVETQIRVTVDLAHASSSTIDGSQYDRVGSWKWLRLPKGTATKKRTRKEGKIDPLPEDTLHLSVEVTCASAPHSRVVCCSSCQAREAKRVARKVAQRVRPQRQDTADIAETVLGGPEGAFNIVQFNCPEVLDFSTGTVVFPLRITCYCRHHRERVGFNVHFTMSDNSGRVVGTGTTQPIMITDDHKSSKPSAAGEVDWSQMSSPVEIAEKGTATKRKQTHTADPPEQSKKRARGSGNPRGTSNKMSRKSSSGSLDSPSVFTSALPTRTTTPSQFFSSGPPSQFSTTAPPSPRPSDAAVNQTSGTFLPSPSASVGSGLGSDQFTFDTSEMVMPSQPLADLAQSTVFERAESPSTFLPTAPPSPATVPLQQMQTLRDSAPVLPFLFFTTNSISPLPIPKIHRLIPSSGPTHGGIEVTVLGANFHPSLQLNCVFGDVPASSTQRWSDNTLVCILPPRVTSGVVAVWFNGIPKEDDGNPPCLFTYTDESDRALMELALQVVGLKMTGKLEDAKSVAMRIVGPSGDEAQSGSSPQRGMQLASNALSPDVRSMLRHVGAGDDFEMMVLNLLSLLDVSLEAPSTVSLSSAVSHQTHSGQTLLHIAAFLKYPNLVQFLLQHGVDVDARDRNGHTALHLACLVGAEDCAAILLDFGADVEIVNALGKTAQEVASFDVNLLPSSDGGDHSDLDEGESRWGDGEEESGDELTLRSHNIRRVPRAPRRGFGTTTSVPSEDEAVLDVKRDTEKPKKVDEMVDEKLAATVMNAIQRTLARVQPTQGIIPNMPHLPLPHLPNLPGMPAVPWGAFPQIPMVFPVYVPWPAFLGEKRGDRPEGLDREQTKGTMRALLTPQEWRAFWEKWLAQGTNAADDEPPPMYTPRAEVEVMSSEAPEAHEELVEDEAPVAGPSIPSHERLAARRVGYDSGPVPDQEVNAYAYRPTKKQARQIRKKEDRMLLLFWIPILFIALLWAFFHGMRIALHSIRTVTPLKAILRI
ncbi:hypothetical protein BV25DRAFT_1884501 [Artomyces pyxidatus]|uniref:Uncharacterized protein n=1 Tax=Artomyces pyxidatus TaxID=48021 RepID=A0ACB8T2Z3_9AGAM|nr:hypothetical protein BV25DRAFT_1884501 [Artomyces pyxidatus]